MAINVAAEKRAYRKFIAAGMTPEGACALIGNLEAESDGFYTNRVEYLCLQRLKENGKIYTDKTYTEAVDSGKISCEEFLHPLPGKQYGYGLAQWTSPERKSGLYTRVKQAGKSIADEEIQIAYVLWELKAKYPEVMKALITETNIREASDVVLKKFESPADTGESICKSRAARGQRFYDSYVNKQEGNTMAHYISNCGHDENNNYHGGQAGDQTGTEWEIREWYSYPWNCVLRHPDANVRALHAKMSEAAAKNDNNGYDQWERDTFGAALKVAGDDPAKINVKCETDCSKGIIDITKAIGRRLGISALQNIQATYTGNMRSYYKAAGYQVLTDSKYLTSPDYLMPGDILLNDVNHVATNITQGSKASAASANASTSSGNSPDQLIGTCSVTLKTFLKDAKDEQIKTIQLILNRLGYKGKNGKKLDIDGELGEDTAYAVEQFQRKQGMKNINYGTVAARTWQLLISAKK